MAKTHKLSGRGLTPLWLFSLFIPLTELAIALAYSRHSKDLPTMVALTAILGTFLISGGFVALLWVKPWHLYSPADYNGTDVATFISAVRGDISGLSDQQRDTLLRLDELQTHLSELE